MANCSVPKNQLLMGVTWERCVGPRASSTRTWPEVGQPSRAGCAGLLFLTQRFFSHQMAGTPSRQLGISMIPFVEKAGTAGPTSLVASAFIVPRRRGVAQVICNLGRAATRGDSSPLVFGRIVPISLRQTRNPGLTHCQAGVFSFCAEPGGLRGHRPAGWSARLCASRSLLGHCEAFFFFGFSSGDDVVLQVGGDLAVFGELHAEGAFALGHRT